MDPSLCDGLPRPSVDESVRRSGAMGWRPRDRIADLRMRRCRILGATMKSLRSPAAVDQFKSFRDLRHNGRSYRNPPFPTSLSIPAGVWPKTVRLGSRRTAPQAEMNRAREQTPESWYMKGHAEGLGWGRSDQPRQATSIPALANARASSAFAIGRSRPRLTCSHARPFPRIEACNRSAGSRC